MTTMWLTIRSREYQVTHHKLMSVCCIFWHNSHFERGQHHVHPQDLANRQYQLPCSTACLIKQGQCAYRCRAIGMCDVPMCHLGSLPSCTAPLPAPQGIPQVSPEPYGCTHETDKRTLHVRTLTCTTYTHTRTLARMHARTHTHTHIPLGIV